MVGFIFDAQRGETPSSLARRRKLAEAMLAQSLSRAPKDMGEGLTAIGQAIAARVLANRADKAEKAGLEGFSGKWGDAFKPQEFPDAPSSTSRSPASTPFGADDLDGYFNAIRSAESGCNDGAKNPRSSASGRYQFIESTWNQLAKEHPDLGLTPNGRFDPDQQERAIRAFTQGNASALAQAGIPIDGGSLYAAHFLGAGGARNVLKSDPNASVASIVGSGVVKANPFLNGMTVADFKSWAGKKGGGYAPHPDVQVASLDPSVGLPEARDPYSLIPERDSRGEDQRAKFREWNSDPFANEASNLEGVRSELQSVIKRAREIAGNNFVLGSGKRDPELQKKAVSWGWSGTEDSDHLGGGAADLWPVDDQGNVIFDRNRQGGIAEAMKQAAQELGVQLDVGADWRKKDMPHFGLVEGEVPTPMIKPARERVADAWAGARGNPQPDPIRARVADALIGQRGGGINVASMREQQMSRLLSPDVMGDGGGFVQTSRDAPIQMAQARNGQMSDADALAGFGARPYQQGQGGPSIEQLYQLAADPWASDEQRAILGNMIKQKQEESDPLRQLQLQKAQLELGALQNPDDWAKLDDGRLFHKRTGEIKEVPGGAAQAEMFGGKSVDAQALNWLVTNGRLTQEQAAQMAAGKTVSGPNGELLFLKPEDVFRQAPGSPAGDAQPGMTQLTPPKVTLDEKKAMTFADRMTTSGGIIDQLGDAGLGFKDRVLSNIPLVGNSLVSDEYQQLDQARRDFINAQLRRESGAVISPEEFDNANKQYFPQPGDTKETLEQKRKNRETAVLGMQRDGGPTYQPPGGALPDGITEDDIDFTMKKHGLTREQVLERLRNAP